MPTKRRRRGRHVRHELSPAIIAFFKDEELEANDTESRRALSNVEFFQDPADFSELWALLRDEIIGDWVKENPGTRPSAWWKYDAPEPRERIGGAGDVMSDFLAYVPSFYRGIPTGWITPKLKERGWPIASVNGKATTWAPIEQLASADAFDANDPPRFEAEATYLQRKGLLHDGERRRIKPADYEPEVAECEDWLSETIEDAAR